MRGCSGVAKTCARRALLDHAAGVEERDAVGDLASEAHLVGGDQHRDAAVLELADRRRAPRRPARGRGPTSPRRAAGPRGPWPARARSRRAAAGRPRAARGSARACRPDRSGPGARRRGASASVRPAAQHPSWGQRHVLQHGAVREEVELLEDDARCGGAASSCRPGLADVDAVEQDAAVVDGLEQVDAAQQRRLAGARRRRSGTPPGARAAEGRRRPAPSWSPNAFHTASTTSFGAVTPAPAAGCGGRRRSRHQARGAALRWRAISQSVRRVSGIVRARKMAAAAT